MQFRTVRAFAVANPFLLVGIASLTLVVIGAMPAGFDYDPDPLRSTIRKYFDPIALPFFVASAAIETLRLGTAISTPLWFLLGLLPYMALDLVWRAARRRFSRKSASEASS